MGIADLLGQYDDNRIAANIAAAPDDFAVRIEHNSIGSRITPGEPVLSRVMLVGVVRISVPFGVSLTTDAPDEPGIDAKLVVQVLEYLPAARVFGTPPAPSVPAPPAPHAPAH